MYVCIIKLHQVGDHYFMYLQGVACIQVVCPPGVESFIPSGQCCPVCGKIYM